MRMMLLRRLRVADCVVAWCGPWRGVGMHFERRVDLLVVLLVSDIDGPSPQIGRLAMLAHALDARGRE